MRCLRHALASAEARVQGTLRLGVHKVTGTLALDGPEDVPACQPSAILRRPCRTRPARISRQCSRSGRST